MRRKTDPDPERTADFIRAHLPLTPVPDTGLRLHLAGPRSGLARLVPPGGTPYWAHAWPGGVALARHLAAHPEMVRGRTVVEFGTGSGLVGIAALKAGASAVRGFDPDPLAAVAARVNSDANGVPAFPVTPATRSPADGAVILAGDVFYDERAARQMTATFDALAGTTILVGDIGRRFLPRDRLEPLASYPVRDLGDPPSAPLHDGWVFRWRFR